MPETHNNLGLTLKEQGKLDAAISSYNTALQLKPNYPDAHNNLGSTLKDKGDLFAAIVNHKKALELDPKSSKAFYGIGNAQAAKGQLLDSKNSFNRAVEIDPNNTAALFGLSKNIKNYEDYKALAQKLDNVTKDKLSRRDQCTLEFAFANFHHSSSNYTKAAKHLIKANKIKLSLYPSDLSTQLLSTEQMAALASQIHAAPPSNGKGRIFIVGAPRCGSTLLESVLSTNSNIRDLGESNALIKAIAEGKDSINANDINFSLSDAYAARTTELISEYTHSVDKNLYNFRLAEAIARAMPSARIIHCRRHPLDNILSMFRSNLQAGNNYTADTLDAAKFLIHQEESMNRFKSTYKNHIFTIDYDLFTIEPEKELRPLINWLGLEWNERYLHPERCNRLINTASAIQARQPITNKSVGGRRYYRELLKPAEEALEESGVFNL